MMVGRAAGAMRRAALASLALALAALPGRADAGVERFALVIGASRGARNEVPLRFALADADKIAGVLIELGQVPPENLVLLKDRDAAAARRALMVMNERVRARRQGGAEIVLYVYYSGHADARALHLGASRLPLADVESLIRGSPADLRVLIIDACRSGALTRVKGGRPARQVRVALDARLRGEGLAILTSVSGSEDAQESDELRGSFFTHYLVSALLGAGDADGDGQVTLREAYRHAYDRTVMASSRTLVGIQHPSFRFDLRGRGDLVLTRVRGGRDRPTVAFPPGLAFVVARSGSDGAVVAELGSTDRARTLSLPQGRLHLVGRARDYLVEGDVELGAGHHTLDTAKLRRVEYARLVRKGAGVLEAVHGPAVGLSVRGPVVAGASPCIGLMVGWPIELRLATIAPRLTVCRSGYSNDYVDSHTDAADAELRVTHAWDLPWITVDLGVAAGAGLLRQTFTTRGEAPDNLSGAAHVDVTGGAAIELGRGAYLATDVAVGSWFLRAADTGDASLTARAAIRVALLAGLRL